MDVSLDFSIPRIPRGPFLVPCGSFRDMCVCGTCAVYTLEFGLRNSPGVPGDGSLRVFDPFESFEPFNDDVD